MPYPDSDKYCNNFCSMMKETIEVIYDEDETY